MFKVIFFVSAMSLSLALAFESNEFSYSRPRPMMALCGDLRDQLGVLITYEDAPCERGTEVTSSVLERNGNTVLTPKWEPVTFRLLPSLSEHASAMRTQEPIAGAVFAAIADVTTQYNTTGNPGRFSAKKDGKYLHIQQRQRRNTGAWETFQPISETTLDWQSEPRSCYAVLGDLSQALAQARGFGIAVGPVPMGALLQRHCAIRELNPTVGDVLKKIMEQLETDPVAGKAAADYGYTWDLVYDPNWNKYFLSIVPVRDHAPSQTPAPILPHQAAPMPTNPKSSNAGTRIGHH